MERTWGFLKPFSWITRNMTPTHRLDFIVLALRHFADRKIDNIGKKFVYVVIIRL